MNTPDIPDDANAALLAMMQDGDMVPLAQALKNFHDSMLLVGFDQSVAHYFMLMLFNHMLAESAKAAAAHPFTPQPPVDG